MDLRSDFRDLLEAFVREGVLYLLVGGYAVGFHSRPRSTKDLDLWIADDAANLAAVERALVSFGAPEVVIDAHRRAGPDDIVWMGLPPGRIDILRRVSGVDFADAYRRRVTATWGGIPIAVIGRDDLIANKRSVGRPQDRRDVRALERSRR